jgi:hypothetical protein
MSLHFSIKLILISFLYTKYEAKWVFCLFVAQHLPVGHGLLIFECSRVLYHTRRRATVGRNPLNEWSARRRDLYLTAQNTRKRQTSVSPVGFEPAISTDELPQTYALDRAATGIGQNRWQTVIWITPFFRSFLIKSGTRLRKWAEVSNFKLHDNFFSGPQVPSCVKTDEDVLIRVL